MIGIFWCTKKNRKFSSLEILEKYVTTLQLYIQNAIFRFSFVIILVRWQNCGGKLPDRNKLKLKFYIILITYDAVF